MTKRFMDIGKYREEFHSFKEKVDKLVLHLQLLATIIEDLGEKKASSSAEDWHEKFKDAEPNIRKVIEEMKNFVENLRLYSDHIDEIHEDFQHEMVFEYGDSAGRIRREKFKVSEGRIVVARKTLRHFPFSPKEGMALQVGKDREDRLFISAQPLQGSLRIVIAEENQGEFLTNKEPREARENHLELGKPYYVYASNLPPGSRASRFRYRLVTWFRVYS